VVVQVELEVCEYFGFYYCVVFYGLVGVVYIEMICFELIFVCVVLIVYLDDECYQSLFGIIVCTLLFDVEVLVLVYFVVEMDKGVGIVMCCIFGDFIDV